MSLSVVIVGSGPSGFYAADSILKKAKDARIDIIDRLPTPYGLVRAGVAPDHQGTKKILRVFERTALKPNVRFLGNVCVGKDISVEELKERYDAVILAYGAARDRHLGVPGEDLGNVFGSWDFVGWYNGHPDYQDLNPNLAVSSVVVVGNGNVAIDVARVIAKTNRELAETDVSDVALRAKDQSGVTDVHMVGRRGPVEGAFTHAELAELGRMEECVVLADGRQLPDEVGDVDDKVRKVKETNLATLHEYAKNTAADKPVRLHLHFYASPVELSGNGSVEKVTFERNTVEDGRCVGTGETFELDAGLVVTCIGYRSEQLEGTPFDERRGVVVNEDGFVEPGLYVVGWAKRGPSGTIATNRPDSVGVAEKLITDHGEGTGRPGPDGLDSLLAQRGVRVVSIEDWKTIDEAEVSAASETDAPRRKLTSVSEMLALLD